MFLGRKRGVSLAGRRCQSIRHVLCHCSEDNDHADDNRQNFKSPHRYPSLYSAAKRHDVLVEAIEKGAGIVCHGGSSSVKESSEGRECNQIAQIILRGIH